VVLIAKGTAPEPDGIPVEEAIGLLVSAGVGRMDAIKTLARERGLSKRDIYKLVSGPTGPKPKH
jgi:hypothetical protein